MHEDTRKGTISARQVPGPDLAEIGLPLEELVRRGARDILQRAKVDPKSRTVSSRV